MLTAVAVTAGAAAALTTLLMIFTRNPVKAAMLMLTALLCTAVIYLAVSAQLLAALQVILYAGAVMTLFIVALTVTTQAWNDRPAPGRMLRMFGLAAAAALLTELLKITASLKSVTAGSGFEESGTLGIARELFGPRVLQFELLSLLVLAAIVGAVALTSRKGAAR